MRFFIRALFGEVSHPKPCFPLGGWPLSNRNIENALDTGLKVGVLFIDFRKAFDIVNHTILLEKQKAIGISGDLFSWIDDYMSTRKPKEEISTSTCALDSLAVEVSESRPF